MAAILIDGKATAQKIRNQLKQEISSLPSNQRKPKLSVILVGDNPASQIYVKMKEKACAEIGMLSEKIILDKNISQETLLSEVKKLNEDESVDGILVQLPLPKHLNEEEVIHYISPNKDVDGFHPFNLGLLLRGQPSFVPCTPLGIKVLLQEYNITTEGKHIVVIGRSNIVGKPAGMLFLLKEQYGNATVTFVHSRTNNIQEIVKTADIIIAAIGSPKFVKADWVKEGTTIIDVGINRLDNGSLCGDVDFDAVKEKAYAITPVPGGVGPMTVAMLLYNTLQAYKHDA